MEYSFAGIESQFIVEWNGEYTGRTECELTFHQPSHLNEGFQICVSTTAWDVQNADFVMWFNSGSRKSNKHVPVVSYLHMII